MNGRPGRPRCDHAAPAASSSGSVPAIPGGRRTATEPRAPERNRRGSDHGVAGLALRRAVLGTFSTYFEPPRTSAPAASTATPTATERASRPPLPERQPDDQDQSPEPRAMVVPFVPRASPRASDATIRSLGDVGGGAHREQAEGGDEQGGRKIHQRGRRLRDDPGAAREEQRRPRGPRGGRIGGAARPSRRRGRNRARLPTGRARPADRRQRAARSSHRGTRRWAGAGSARSCRRRGRTRSAPGSRARPGRGGTSSSPTSSERSRGQGGARRVPRRWPRPPGARRHSRFARAASSSAAPPGTAATVRDGASLTPIHHADTAIESAEQRNCHRRAA